MAFTCVRNDVHACLPFRSGVLLETVRAIFVRSWFAVCGFFCCVNRADRLPRLQPAATLSPHPTLSRLLPDPGPDLACYPSFLPSFLALLCFPACLCVSSLPAKFFDCPYRTLLYCRWSRERGSRSPGGCASYSRRTSATTSSRRESSRCCPPPDAPAGGGGGGGGGGGEAATEAGGGGGAAVEGLPESGGEGAAAGGGGGEDAKKKASASAKVRE